MTKMNIIKKCFISGSLSTLRTHDIQTPTCIFYSHPTSIFRTPFLLCNVVFTSVWNSKEAFVPWAYMYDFFSLSRVMGSKVISGFISQCENTRLTYKLTSESILSFSKIATHLYCHKNDDIDGLHLTILWFQERWRCTLRTTDIV